MQHSNSYQNSSATSTPTEDEDRTNRFLQPSSAEHHGTGSLRERAASQPPRTPDQSFLSSPSQSHVLIPSTTNNAHNSNSPWGNLSPTSRGLAQAIPGRSSSFSNPQANFSSVMRESRAFPSTFEDDESQQGLDDSYDERYIPQDTRGRTYAQDLSRSRSQSLATTRPGPIGSPYLGSPLAMASWNNESPLAQSIPGARYGEIKPPGNSRYGSLGTMARSPINIHAASSPTGGQNVVGNGYSQRQSIDVSNMSPFVRDVGQILEDEGAFRKLWVGVNPPRDENGGGGSGTTSRRHSVSVVQPRRPGNIVGFNVPGSDTDDEPTRPLQPTGFGSRGGLMLSDDDLASDFGNLNLNNSNTDSGYRPTDGFTTSQPSSLPIYAPPLSRSPPNSSDRLSPYQPLNNLGAAFSQRGSTRRGSSPNGSESQFDQQLAEAQYFNGSHQQQHNAPGNSATSTARFIPGQGIIQYQPPQQQQQQNRARAPSYTNNTIPSPISPNGTRTIVQQPYYGSQARRPSDAPPPQHLQDLGKGVPLHSVPASWPLFIVEFKAGRTDLFYLTDLSQEIRVGDLVIVEADRGKDLGKVVNDSITLQEVDAFQRQQLAKAAGPGGLGGGGGDGEPPQSPGGTAMGRKEINPKMIYGKAQPQDTQLLLSKMQDEAKALQLCQSKVRAKKLPMEVVDAEYQWDRRKLTFYFVADKRIDFRELVRELFRLYKTRIWMASLQGGGGFEQ